MSGGLFGIGSGELLLILLIILIVMGPERLPQLARQWGRLVRMAGKITGTWHQMNAELMRQLDEEAKPLQDVLQQVDPAKPAPDEQAEPQEPDPESNNTIAPPEFVAQPAPPDAPPPSEVAEQPDVTDETAESRDG